MDNETPEKRALNGKEPDALEVDLLPLERRLLADGDHWARRVSAATLTKWIHTLPAPGSGAPAEPMTQHTKETETASVMVQQPSFARTPHTRTGDDNSMEGLRSLTIGQHGPRRTFGALATLTVVVVVALMGGLFFAIGPGRSHGVAIEPPASGTQAATVGRPTPTPGVAVPGSYPGPQAAHIVFAVTAHHIDQYHNPIGVDTNFKVGENFFVVVTVKGLSATQAHTISVVWLLNGIRIESTMGGSVREVTSHTGSAMLAFGMVYSAKGTGEVKIYWDPAIEPPNDDRALGQMVVFTIS